jgi:hypothetical protein
MREVKVPFFYKTAEVDARSTDSLISSMMKKWTIRPIKVSKHIDLLTAPRVAGPFRPLFRTKREAPPSIVALLSRLIPLGL